LANFVKLLKLQKKKQKKKKKNQPWSLLKVWFILVISFSNYL
jgi:hypothetical protein